MRDIHFVGSIQLETAEQVFRTVPDFGIATECGFGRRAPETILDLLRLHAQL
jgi:hypothetical protein